MNNFTLLQRKMVYLGGVIVLLIPITWLGLPPEPAPGGRIEPGSGGKLAQERAYYELGEASLGNVDPASSTMNLLLLGFRGVATSSLWMDAQKQQKAKDWSGLRATTDSIILLQPHFLKVWHFQGWNMAYNVSAEWDLVADRYYWVKEGIKFFMRGKERNEKYPELYWYIGDACGKKIGRSDEWVQFRKFFMVDPDTERFLSGPDTDLNPSRMDNYLVAKTWFEKSNKTIDDYGHMEHIMAEILFRSYPQRAQMDFATALQRDGQFDEVARVAWEEAFQEWTEIYGARYYPSPPPAEEPVKLEVSEEELEQIRKADAQRPPEKQLEGWIKRFQDMTNYRFWRVRAKVESEATMADAHRLLYEGEQRAKAADYVEAQDKLWNGMTKLEEMLDKYTDLKDDDSTIEEALIAQLFWRDCLDIEEKVPDEAEGYPLQELWNKHQVRLPSIKDEKARRQRAVR
ncbi:MAG: hypothetical protein EXS05_02745 [Planctomycetaceae bacterium]|nr:hypothetical protein [Planctomycetaceae bacterium]